MRHLKRLIRYAVRLWEAVPVTFLGLAAAGVGWGAWHFYGNGKADYVLHSAGLVTMALAAIAVVFVLAGTLVLWLLLRRTRVAPVERSVDTGVEVDTGFRLPSLRFWPFIDVHMRWEAPALVDVHLDRSGRETITPRERGRVASIVRRFTVHDIFGLGSVAFSMRWPAALRVAPSKAHVDLSLVLRPSSGDGWSHPAGEPVGELIEMRRYGPGDPTRLILWKHYARSRRLLVRVPERAVIPRPSTVAYLVAGERDEPAATTARTFLESDHIGTDFVFSADGEAKAATSTDGAVEHLIDSVRYRDRGGQGLARLLLEVDRGQLGNCVVFVPGTAGPWMAPLAAFAAKLPAPPTVVVTVEGSADLGRAPGRLRRLLFRRDGPSDPVMDALPALCDALARFGGPVRVLHHPSGRLIGEHELRLLRRA